MGVIFTEKNYLIVPKYGNGKQQPIDVEECYVEIWKMPSYAYIE